MMIAYLSLLVLSNCGYPRSVSYFFIGNAGVFLYLFSDFYRKAYNKGGRPPTTNGISNGSIKTLSNGHANSNGNGVTPSKTASTFVDDSEAYLQITRDVALLNSGEKLIKMKNL